MMSSVKVFQQSYLPFVMILLFSNVASCQSIRPLVTLQDLNKGLTIVGEDAKLECRTTFNSSFVSLEWELPKSLSSAKVSVEKQTEANSTYGTISRLNIHKLPLIRNDNNCKCKAVHKQWHYAFYSDDIYILVHHSSVLNLNSRDTKDEDFKVPELVAEINMAVFPEASATWLNPEQETINVSSTRFLISTEYISTDQSNRIYKLKFNNITDEDFGVYKIMVQIEEQVIFREFNIYLKEKPHLDLSIHNVTENDTITIYKCVAAANPKPSITWLFNKCGMADCFYRKNYTLTEKMNELYYINNGLQVISYVSLNLSRSSGIIKCVSGASEVTSVDFYVEDGFDIGLEKRTLQNKTFYAGYGENVNIFCSLSLYDHAQKIKWFINNREIEKSSYIYTFKNYTTIDKYVEFMEFHYVQEDQTGKYTCEILNRRGEIRSKSVSLIQKRIYSFYPRVSMNDLSNGHTSKGLNLTLKCEVTFYAFVKIMWKFTNTTGVENDTVVCKSAIDIDTQNTKILYNKTLVNRSVYVTLSYLTIFETSNSNGGYYCCVIEPEDPKMVIHYKYKNNNYIWVPIYGIVD